MHQLPLNTAKTCTLSNEHLEDSIFNNGVAGTRDSILFLISLRNMLDGKYPTRTTVTTKFDGAPAIICGINPENGKFFVGTKGVFAQTPKINYTDSDIDNNHESPALREKLKIALKYLSQLGIRGVLQGDMMFTENDLSIKKIDDVNHVTFRPNTILYAVPKDTPLAKDMMAAKMGIVFHTAYHGKTLATSQPSFNVDLRYLRPSPDVWFRNADLHLMSGVANFVSTESNTAESLLSAAGSLFRKIPAPVLNTIATNEDIKTFIKTYNNKNIREGRSIPDSRRQVLNLVKFVTDSLNKSIKEAKRADTKKAREQYKGEILRFFNTNFFALRQIYELYSLITEAKLMIVSKLSKIEDMKTFLETDDGFKVTPAEGFVAFYNDSQGSVVKLVDRLTFSHANFTVAKNWTK